MTEQNKQKVPPQGIYMVINKIVKYIVWHIIMSTKKIVNERGRGNVGGEWWSVLDMVAKESLNEMMSFE